ncbi:MAG: FtsX-like permease family protein [Candidatus Marinamargulisbacteria bacterium]
MNTVALFQLIIGRYYAQNWVKLVLTCLGISLGLSLFVTTRSYSDTILHYVSKQTAATSFSNTTIKSKQGRISLSDYYAISALPMVDHVIAKVEKMAMVRNMKTGDDESLKIWGIDMINVPSNAWSVDADAVDALFSLPYHGITNGGSDYMSQGELTIHHHQKNTRIPVVDTGSFDDNTSTILVLDLVAFYNYFPSITGLTEMDVVIEDHLLGALNQALAAIHPSLYAAPPHQHAETTKKITDSFSLNLMFLSTFSILVSGLISYQFFNFISGSRQKTYEICLAMGMTQWQLVRLVFIEMGTIFLVSYGLAIAIGTQLGAWSLWAVKETISTLYYPIHPSDVSISFQTLWLTGLIGSVTCVVNGLAPWMAIRSKTSFFRHGFYLTKRQSLPWLVGAFIVGSGGIGASMYFLGTFIKFTGSVYGGYINMGLFLVGIMGVVPLILMGITHVLKAIKSPAITSSLVAIEKHLVKNWVTIGALSLAFCLYLTLSFFIQSFRTTVIDWIETSNWADVYIYNQANRVTFEVPLPADLLTQFKEHPDVELWDPISHYKIMVDGHPTSVLASKASVLNTYKRRLKLKDNIPMKDPMAEVYVSESFYQKTGRGVGDSLIVNGDHGPQRVRIVDIFYSYGTDQGVIQMSTVLAQSLFNDVGVHGLGIKLNKSIKDTRFFVDFQAASDQQGVLLSSNQGLRDRALQIFDQTFKITWMLALISGLIAALALINYVSIAVMDRWQELRQIRAIGGSHAFIFRYIYVQIGGITWLSVLVSLGMTLGILYILIHAINRPIFGWTMTMHYRLPPVLVVGGLCIIMSYVTLWGVYSLKKHRLDTLRVAQND